MYMAAFPCYVVMRHVGMYSEYEVYAERVFFSRDEAEAYITSLKFEVDDWPVGVHEIFSGLVGYRVEVPTYNLVAWLHPTLQRDGYYVVKYPQRHGKRFAEYNLDETYWTIEEVPYGA